MIIWRNPSSSVRINSWDICCNLEALFGLNFEEKAEKTRKNVFFLKKVLRKRNFALSLHSQSGSSERNNASLAQLVEHDTLNVGVQGSSP